MTKTALPLRLLATIMAIGVTGAVFGLSQPVRAAENLGYQISPPVTEIVIEPGTGTRGKIKVTNLTSRQITLKLEKTNFKAKGEEGEVELVDGVAPLYSLAPYFRLDTDTIDIAPTSSHQVEFFLDIPQDAEPGGRYGSVTFNTIPTRLPTGQSGASIKQQLAALIFVRINGKINEQLRIDSFKVGRSFQEYGPISFTTRINNLGSVHEKPTGVIVVKNMLGITTATIKLDEKNVLPAAIRKINSSLERKLMFGSYSAVLTLKNGTQQTLTAATSFIVIPYRLILGILAVLFLIGFVFRKRRRRIVRAIRILAGRE